MLELFVWDAACDEKIPVAVRPAADLDFAATQEWQTRWDTEQALQFPNKVALYRTDQKELLGLMSYALDDRAMAVEIVYLESAPHSNANLLHKTGGQKRYYGIAKALFAHAVQLSLQAGFDGVLVFRAKTSGLLEYYTRVLGARRVAAYDPFRMVVWEDAAQRIIAEYRRDPHG